jgi:hypothetical protein
MSPTKIKMLVRQIRYQEVEISTYDDQGYDYPKTLNDMVKFCSNMKDTPLDFCLEGNWSDIIGSEVEVITFDITEV